MRELSIESMQEDGRISLRALPKREINKNYDIQAKGRISIKGKNNYEMHYLPPPENIGQLDSFNQRYSQIFDNQVMA